MPLLHDKIIRLNLIKILIILTHKLCLLRYKMVFKSKLHSSFTLLNNNSNQYCYNWVNQGNYVRSLLHSLEFCIHHFHFTIFVVKNDICVAELCQFMWKNAPLFFFCFLLPVMNQVRVDFICKKFITLNSDVRRYYKHFIQSILIYSKSQNPSQSHTKVFSIKIDI
jgi:hypothetical protein